MWKSSIIWNGNSKKIQFSPSKSLCHKKLGPKQQKDLTMNFFCFWCVSAKILQWAFSISIYNFCWIYIKHFYNHYKFFSQITKTNYLLGNNTWANIIIQTSSLLRWFWKSCRNWGVYWAMDPNIIKP